MSRRCRLLGSFAVLLASVAPVCAQEIPQPGAEAAALPVARTRMPANAPETPGFTEAIRTASRYGPAFGLESESLPDQIAEDDKLAPRPRQLGPIPVDEVGFLMNTLGLKRLFGNSGIRTFGWIEGGSTYSSTGPGLLSVEPRQNRYGNQFLLNQLGLVLQKPLRQDQFDIGFNVRYFAGADAALGAAKGGIGFPPGNPRFGQDFRDLYIDAHLPILTERGMDIRIGRMNTIIGYNGFLAPYRPFYSSDYQFFYSQDGAFTGILANLHVSNQLELWSGLTLGANTFYTLRSNDSYCYIGQANYWVTPEKRTRLTGSVYAGPNALFAAPGLAGTFDTMVGLRVQHAWNRHFTQIVQSNMGWDPGSVVGTGSWYGVYTIGILHLNRTWDLLGRVEWFDDVKGTRTGIDTNYEEVTFGFNWHPVKYLDIRPEIRGDFANAPAFGRGGVPRDHNQLTCAMSALIRF